MQIGTDMQISSKLVLVIGNMQAQYAICDFGSSVKRVYKF